MDRIARLKEFLAQNPADSFVQHALALEYVKEGNNAAAKEQFEQLLAQDENYVGSYYHLGKLLERMGDQKEAIAVYEQGLQKAKEMNDTHAYNELLAAYEDLTY